MSDDVNNPHDRLFKEVFQQEPQAAAWFEGALPPELVAQLDMGSLTTSNSSFRDPELKELHADLLFSVSSKTGDPVLLYLLFEHQSTPDPMMAWRLLRYSARIWDVWTSENPSAKRLPPIIPLVLYHGHRRWKSPMSMREQLDGPPELHEAIGDLGVDLRYTLADLSHIDDAQLWGRSLGLLAQLLMKHAADGELWERLPAWRETLAGIKDDPGLQAAERVLNYIKSIAEQPPSPRVLQMLRETLDPAVVEDLMTWADQLREEGLQKGLQKGLQRGLQKGRLEGRQEGRGDGVREALLRLLAKRFGDVPEDVQAQVMAADGDALLAAIDRAVTASTIDEIFEG